MVMCVCGSLLVSPGLQATLAIGRKAALAPFFASEKPGTV